MEIPLRDIRNDMTKPSGNGVLASVVNEYNNNNIVIIIATIKGSAPVFYSLVECLLKLQIISPRCSFTLLKSLIIYMSSSAVIPVTCVFCFSGWSCRANNLYLALTSRTVTSSSNPITARKSITIIPTPFLPYLLFQLWWGVGVRLLEWGQV